MKRFLSLLATLVLVFACAPIAPQAPSTGLGGTAWQLLRFQGGDGTILTPDDKVKYAIAFNADGTFSARIDCNRGRGGWKSSTPGQLEFGPMVLTRAMCPPGSLHDHLVKHFPFVRSYVVRDSRLFLSLMADGGIYEFEAERRVIDEPLENTYWRLAQLGDAPVRAAPNQREPHFILHPADRRVSGSGGCNSLTGSYERDGDRVTFGRMASTMMACLAGMETEKNFLAALQQARGARIKGLQLELLDASGSVLGRFEAVHFR